MTRFWKAVLLILLIALIMPIMLLVGLVGWYAAAQSPRTLEDARQQLLRERDLVASPPKVAKQEFRDFPFDVLGGEKLVRDDIGDARLEELRSNAALAEKRSIERASVIRERLKQSEGIGDAEVKQALRTELRVVVLEAFKARQDLHAAEVASLEMQARAMKRKLAERETSSSEIVDRRVEELLNPAKQWNVESPAANVLSRESTPVTQAALDRKNARSVVEAYVAAAAAGRIDEAASLAKGSPAARDRIEALTQLQQRFGIKSVYVSDPAAPATALATSEAVLLTKKQPDGRRDGFLVLTLTMSELTMSEEGWFVTDIDFESEESAEGELKRFLEANPNAVGVPPLHATLLPGTDSGSSIGY